MLRAYSFDPTGAKKVDDPDEISDLLEDDSTVVWVDAVNPSHEELATLEHEFELHPLALEDVRNRDQRPKLEVYPSHAFLVVYVHRDGDGEMEEVFVFVGPDWIVTVHHHEGPTAHFDIDGIRRRYTRTVGMSCNVGFLVYVVLDEVVDSYFSAVDRIEEKLSDLEDKIFDDADPEGDEQEIQQAMLHLRRDLLAFRRRAIPLRDVVLSLLRGEVDWVSADARVYLQDVFDHLLRIADEIDNQRELIGNAVDAHLALVSNQMNEIMKKMTSWGAILLGSTLIAGIYGMNFDEMPELRWRFGYLGAIGSMAVLTIILYRTFKRRHWL